MIERKSSNTKKFYIFYVIHFTMYNDRYSLSEFILESYKSTWKCEKAKQCKTTSLLYYDHEPEITKLMLITIFICSVAYFLLILLIQLLFRKQKFSNLKVFFGILQCRHSAFVDLFMLVRKKSLHKIFH